MKNIMLLKFKNSNHNFVKVHLTGLTFGFQFIIFQMTCDASMRITSCAAQWPGSIHDARIFRSSHLCRHFVNGKHNCDIYGTNNSCLVKFSYSSP